MKLLTFGHAHGIIQKTHVRIDNSETKFIGIDLILLASTKGSIDLYILCVSDLIAKNSKLIK